MEERSSGLILRTRPLTETSLIVHWLTAEEGRVATVAKGARRPKSPFSGKLDIFYEGQFSYVRSRRSELHTLREVVLVKLYGAIRQDLSRLHAAAYGAVLIEQGTERETPLPEFYALLKALFEELDRQPPSPALILSLELKFLELTGVAPSLEGGLPPDLARLAGDLVRADLASAGSIKLSGPACAHLSLFLRRAIGMALEKLPPQRERLLQSLITS